MWYLLLIVQGEKFVFSLKYIQQKTNGPIYWVFFLVFTVKQTTALFMLIKSGLDE